LRLLSKTFGGRSSKKFNMKLLIFAVMCCLVLISAYASTNYLWSAPTTVAISTFSPYIKVYYGDREVTSINFGNLIPGASVGILLRIVNTHPNATFYNINWNSTLKELTNKIRDEWWAPWPWPLSIAPRGYVSTEYRITVASDCPLATYTWTLYLYGSG